MSTGQSRSEKSKTYELFVVEKNRLLGVVTVRDILKVSDITGAKVSALETHVPHVVRSDTVSKAARIMTEHRMRAVPILDDGRLVGQLSLINLRQFVTGGKTELDRRDNHDSKSCNSSGG